MQNYPNYLINNYPQYQQPQYQPMANPYADRLAQMQAYQQQLSQPQMQMAGPVQGISGRVVEDFNAIVANDVPMDGFGAIFVKADGTEIQRRSWTKDGTITTTRFKAQTEDLEPQTVKILSNDEKLKIGLSDEATEAFMQRFDDISERLEKLEKFIKPTAYKAKKEGGSDD